MVMSDEIDGVPFLMFQLFLLVFQIIIRIKHEECFSFSSQLIQAERIFFISSHSIFDGG
jgi:hypothetical protein